MRGRRLSELQTGKGGSAAVVRPPVLQARTLFSAYVYSPSTLFVGEEPSVECLSAGVA
jgi:hypothetical protein